MTAAPRPWMKFSPKRWRNDEALRMCGPAARGLWVELICIMHEAEPYGHLVVREKQPPTRMLAVMTGIAEADLPGLLAELEANEVFSRTDDAIIYSRGMVRDEEEHQFLSGCGKKGVAAKARKTKAEKAPLRGGSSGGSSRPSRGGSRLESEEESEKKNPPVVPQGTKTTIPDDWKPLPFGADSNAYRIIFGWSGDELTSRLESFKSHHRAKGSRYIDWQQAWATWVNNTQNFEHRDQRLDRPRSSSAAPPTHADVVLREMEDAAGRERVTEQ